MFAALPVFTIFPSNESLERIVFYFSVMHLLHRNKVSVEQQSCWFCPCLLDWILLWWWRWLNSLKLQTNGPRFSFLSLLLFELSNLSWILPLLPLFYLLMCFYLALVQKPQFPNKPFHSLNVFGCLFALRIMHVLPKTNSKSPVILWVFLSVT